MSTPQQVDSTDDWIALLMLLTGASGFGLFSVGAFVAPVREWLVQWGVLVQGESALIPIMGDVGLDLWRTLIAAGMVVLLVAGSIFAVRCRRRRAGR